MQQMKNSGIEWVGLIPYDWRVVLLSSIFHQHQEKNAGLHETNLLSLSYGRIIKKDINTSEGLLPASFETYNIIDCGDIVFRLTDLQNDQRSLRTGLSTQRGIITSAYITLRPNVELDSRFMHYLYHSYDICKVFYGMGDGVRQGMNFDDLKKLLTLFPLIDEQKEIADLLDIKCGKIDELIAHEEKLIEQLKEYKQSVITEAVTKGLNKSVSIKDSEIEWIGQIPQGWKINRIKYVATYNDDVLDDKLPSETEINYVDIGSVTFEKGIESIEALTFNAAPSRARRITRKGDIIISTVRTYLKAITRINEDNLIVSTGFCVLRPKKVLDKYLEFFCKSNNFTENVSRNSVGISYPAINAKDLTDFAICHPSYEEQQVIADYLDNKCAYIDDLIATKQLKIEELKEYKKSLIFEYVTGKKEVV